MSRIKQITQGTNKTTAVKANAYNAIITTVALTDALDTSFVFRINNNRIRPTSNIQLTPVNTRDGIVALAISGRGRGYIDVRVANVGVAAFNSAISINMTVIG